MPGWGVLVGSPVGLARVDERSGYVLTAARAPRPARRGSDPEPLNFPEAAGRIEGERASSITSAAHIEEAAMWRIGAVLSVGVGLSCWGPAIAEYDLPPLLPPSPGPSTATASATPRPAGE